MIDNDWNASVEEDTMDTPTGFEKQVVETMESYFQMTIPAATEEQKQSVDEMVEMMRLEMEERIEEQQERITAMLLGASAIDQLCAELKGQVGKYRDNYAAMIDAGIDMGTLEKQGLITPAAVDKKLRRLMPKTAGKKR